MLLTKLKLAILLASAATLLVVGASRGLGQAPVANPFAKPSPASQPTPKSVTLDSPLVITPPATDPSALNQAIKKS